jgi:hypothetical protein
MLDPFRIQRVALSDGSSVLSVLSVLVSLSHGLSLPSPPPYIYILWTVVPNKALSLSLSLSLGPSCVLLKCVPQGRTESGGIVLAANAGPRVLSGGVTLKRRCTYRPLVIYLIVNKLLSLSPGLISCLVLIGEASRLHVIPSSAGLLDVARGVETPYPPRPDQVLTVLPLSGHCSRG